MGRRYETAAGVVLLAFLATGCLPESGDDAPKIQLGFVDPASSTSEGDALNVAIQLTLRGLAELDEDLVVTLRDTGTGTAQAGSDYVALGSTSLVFPAGSVDGAVRSVAVAALLDDAFEGADETIELELVDLVGTGALTTSEHAVVLREQDAPSVRFVSAATTTPDEASASYEFDVEFALRSGTVLEVPVDFTVAIAAASSAAPGFDYLAIGTGQLTFPAGTDATENRTVTVNVYDDGTFEGDETILFTLQGVTPGVELEASTTHNFTITDDDAPLAATLQVSSDDGGGALAVSSGGALDLGARQLDTGPTAPLLLELVNQGTLPVTLSPLDLVGHTSDFRLELDLPESSPPPATELPFPLVEAGRDVLEGVLLEPHELALDAVDGLEHVLLHGLPLPDGSVTTHATLRLERLALPWADDLVVHVDGVEVPVDSLVGDLSLWKGEALGFEGSTAFLSFSSAGSRGWVRLGDGPEETLHLVSETAQGGTPPSARLVSEGLMAAQRTVEHAGCAGVRHAPGVHAPDTESLIFAEELPSVGVVTSECRLALETDYQFFEQFAGAAELTEYVTQLVGFVSAQFEEDVQARFTIAYLGIHTDADDGWTTQETPGADTGDLLDEFRAAWANNFPVEADLAHFLSGDGLGGGIAYVGTLCNQSFGFGVSANLRGWIDWETFDGSPDPLNWDFVVLAHELGHNFGATHTHSHCPPLDHCSSNCDGSTACESSTLMSYCHTCAGGLNNVQLRFHPRNADIMRQRILSSCLADWEIGGGGTASFRLLFDPVTAVGARSATIDFTHDAPNQPSPFFIELTGSATE